MAKPYKELGVTILNELKIATRPNAIVKLAQGSVVSFEGDVIINAANAGGVGGGGVDGAVNNAGGPDLVRAREALPLVDKSSGIRIPPGQARTTKAFGKLKCKRVVHAVSANFSFATTPTEVETCNRIVQSAYASALEAAKDFQTIGFSLLSAGIYRGDQSLSHVLNLGVETIVNQIRPNQIVYLVAFTDDEVETLRRILTAYADKS